MADGYGHLPRGPKRLLMATRWSMQGLRAAWLYESSFRLEVVVVLVMAPLGLLLGDTGVERALLAASILLVLPVELLNSAVEAVIERYGPEHHELAGRAKDMGSAAVFLSLASAALVWLAVLAG
jgi:diacylglycerol kinase (ATP)